MLCFSLVSTPARAAGLECVPYARELSGIRIFGDAHTWWGQAKGRYARGSRPAVGSVMAMKPHGNMQLGHVAYVSEIVGPREIRLHHANWSTIDGRRGHIERNVKAVDVSDDNDWSKVRIWYTPIGALGGTHYPIAGFIYSDEAPTSNPGRQWASAPAKAAPTVHNPPNANERKAFAQSILTDLPREQARPARRPARPARTQVASRPYDLIGELIGSHGN